MLRDIEDLVGGTIHATDGKIGEIRSFYFDDREWVVRYLLVATSPWFNSRDVLVSLECFKDVDWSGKSYPVSMTKEMVRRSPDLDSGKPVSRSQEEEIVQYYGWQEYWNVRALERRPLAGTEAGRSVAVAPPELRAPVLKNTREVFGYAICARDGEIGTLRSFLVDDVCWQIRYAIVDTGAWMPGRQVLVPPELIEEIDWEDANISVRLTRQEIRNAPGYDPRAPFTRADEEILCRYFDRFNK